jgi:hypothetical protein
MRIGVLGAAFLVLSLTGSIAEDVSLSEKKVPPFGVPESFGKPVYPNLNLKMRNPHIRQSATYPCAEYYFNSGYLHSALCTRVEAQPRRCSCFCYGTCGGAT